MCEKCFEAEMQELSAKCYIPFQHVISTIAQAYIKHNISLKKKKGMQVRKI